METQICTKCHEEKALDKFYRDRRKASGHRPSCKDCDKARVRQGSREYSASECSTIFKVCASCGQNKALTDFYTDKYKANGYRSYCKACVRADRRVYSHEYYFRNRNDVLAKMHTYHQANAGAIRKRRQKYYANNKEALRSKMQKYYVDNKQSVQGMQAAWRQANRAKLTEYRQRRRALELAAFVEDVELSVLRERDGDNCYLCGMELDFNTKAAVHLEHKIPLSRGGLHSYANTALACQPCNLKKHSKTVEEFLLTI